MGYYAENLSGERLRECYEIAPPRVKQYLNAEIAHVLGRVGPDDRVLEVGCGYGRVTSELATRSARAIGIDSSPGSIDMARRFAGRRPRCEFLVMDATAMAFLDDQFDSVACIQNGICAFGVDKSRLVREMVRVTRPGGKALFSSYSERFWPHRLGWFQLQAERGLLGEIDYDSTSEGEIVCKDGFRSGIMKPADFQGLCSRLGLKSSITEVDESSVFCEVVAPGTNRPL